MRIQSIQVNNFKSLVDFDLPLSKFTCLIGLNGSGKSTVLQFIDFLAQLMRGDIKGWLEERNWTPKEITSKFSSRKHISFTVKVLDDNEQTITWVVGFNTNLLHCIRESITVPGANLLVQKGIYKIHDFTGRKTAPSERISFRYQGSLLSQLKENLLPESLKSFKRFIESIHSLELLSPSTMRLRSRDSNGILGLGGQKLSAFLHELGLQARKQLTGQLKKIYKQLETIDTKSLRSGWKQLEIREKFKDREISTEARHINDGLLRLIAILAELQTKDQLLLLDEIENGINPEIIEFLMDTLVKAKQQVLVTTHSPMILNYLDDDVARQGVMYLYKTTEGYTKAIPFFSIPSLSKKLNIMGPGEVFVDTDLIKLPDEIKNFIKSR